MTRQKSPYRYSIGNSGQVYDWVCFFRLTSPLSAKPCNAAIRQQCCCRSCIVIQVSEYLLNNYWVFDTGNYLDETCAIATFIS